VEETVHDVEEARTGAEPDLIEAEGAVGTGEPILEEAVEGTGGMPVRETGADNLYFEDYPGDDFEKVGEFTPEETSQTPHAPIPEHPAETPFSTELRKKRFKTLAGRTDLP